MKNRKTEAKNSAVEHSLEFTLNSVLFKIFGATLAEIYVNTLV